MNRIKKLRKEKGLTLNELSNELLNNVDLKISSNALGKYEREEREPKLETWQKLADYFNVSIDYLVGRDLKNKNIKSYRFYIFNKDYTLKKLGVTVPTSESEAPVLDKSEFEALKYSLESNDRLSDSLYDLCRLYYSRLYYVDEISDDSFEKLTRILVNKEAFYAEVIEHVDS